MTISDLARVAGVDARAVRSIELGEISRGGSITVLEDILSALGHEFDIHDSVNGNTRH